MDDMMGIGNELVSVVADMDDTAAADHASGNARP